MNKLIFTFILVGCVNSSFAQQRIVIKDSVLLSVLDSFIDELKFEERNNKIIRIGLISFLKRQKVISSDTVSVGGLKGLVVDTEDDFLYSFTIGTSGPINIEEVTYYSTYRKILILMTTGFEDLMQIDQMNKQKLMQEIKKSSNPNSFVYPIIWGVEVKNIKATILKSP